MELTDNYWVRDSSLSTNDVSTTNGVNVDLTTGSFSQDATFVFNPVNYTLKNSVSTWYNYKKSYDRFFYFYNEKTAYQIPHSIDWYLSNDNGTSWKKIGGIDTGNQNNYNQTSGATSSYATRYYSHSILVPAEMDLKVEFSFPFDYTPDNIPSSLDLPRTVFAVIRSGKWRTIYSSETIV